jgi:hypothetical protein
MAGRHAVSSLLPDGRFLVIIYEQEEEEFVVTAVKSSKEGARRVGFTRI